MTDTVVEEDKDPDIELFVKVGTLCVCVCVCKQLGSLYISFCIISKTNFLHTD